MNLIKPLLCVAALIVPMSASVAAENSALATIEQEVTEQVMAFNQAYEVNDLEAYFSFYEEGATMWFNTDFVAIADYQKEWHQMIEQGGGIEQNILSDLRVSVGPSGDSAAASYRLEVVTRLPNGDKTRDNSQESDTWFKKDGEWRVAHLHYASQPAE